MRALIVAALGLSLLALWEPTPEPLPVAPVIKVPPPPSRALHEYIIAREAERVGLDTTLAVAISRWENPKSDPRAWSPNGCCVGLMQVNVSYWHGSYDQQCGTELYNPRVNACYGVRIFLWHLQQEAQDTLRALAAYSGYARNYVARVLARRADLEE